MIVWFVGVDEVLVLVVIVECFYWVVFIEILEVDVFVSCDEVFFVECFVFLWECMLVVCLGEMFVGFLFMSDGYIDMLFMDLVVSGRGSGLFFLEVVD